MTFEALLTSISSTISDYRASSSFAPNESHVAKWIAQFPEPVRLPILSEMNHVLEKTYFSKTRIVQFLDGLLNTVNLVGQDPASFLRGAKFLEIQGGGGSQREMLALLDLSLKAKFGFGVKDCGNPASVYVYIDDAIFTGNRVRRDLETWIAGAAPARATLHVITVAIHSGGQFYAKGRIEQAAKSAGKEIDITWWRAIELEDRRAYSASSDVLRPVYIPDDDKVAAYVAAMEHKPHLRPAGQVGVNGLFSSDTARQTLESEFLKAGVRVREMAPHLGDTQRPLGHMTLETLGFGALIVTFRNCPNNAPLALWAGDPWYPLFPRTTNSDTSFARFIAGLEV